jgi:enoyl-CoA hydratase/carnithine racemase
MNVAPVIQSCDGKVLTITLNRPEVRNALRPDMFTLLADMFAAAEADSSVEVVRFTGAGVSFSAGGDAKAKPENFDDGWRELTRLLIGVQAMRKPVVAKVRGHAIGIGATLALLADFVTATEGAKFHYPFVHMGLVPEGTRVATRLMTPTLARSFVILGEPMSGAAAAAAGVIHRAVPEAELDSSVDQLTHQLLTLPPGAFANSKQALQIAATTDLSASLDWERRTQATIRSAPGYAEFRAEFFRRAGVRPDTWG